MSIIIMILLLSLLILVHEAGHFLAARAFGIKVDKSVNDGLRGEDKVISTPDSRVAALCIATNEELAICRETVALVK